MAALFNSKKPDDSRPDEGTLIVLEGADGVGKTTLCKLLCERLTSEGIPTVYYAFPGCRKDSLGTLVYKVHHDPKSYCPAGLNPLSLQMLHVAAHIDCIEGYILPALRSGMTVILDRSWLSTKIYGLAEGLSASALDKLLEIERSCWADVTTKRLFVIHREVPLKQVPNRHWLHIQSLYDDFLREKIADDTVLSVDNNSSVEVAVADISRSIIGS